MEDSSNIYGSGLDLTTVNQLKEQEKNWNDDWLGGDDCKGAMSKEEVRNRDTSENVKGAVNGIVNSLQLINNAVLTPKLTAYAVSYVTEVLTSYLQKSVVEMLSFDGKAIMSYATQLMPQYLVNAGDLMKELLTSRESMNDQLVEKKEQELIKKFNSSLGEATSKVSYYVKDGLEKVGPQIADVCYYTQMGPVWFMNNYNMAINKCIESPIKGITTIKANVNENKKEFIENTSYTMAQKIAQRKNDKLKNEIKQKLDEKKKKIADTLATAKTQVLNAKLMLFALIGG